MRVGHPLRIPFLALGFLSLVLGVITGFRRLGLDVPLPSESFYVHHGTLMVTGFVATLVGLERAVALGARWAYAAPVLTGGGALLMLAGLTEGPALVSGTALLVVVLALLFKRLPTFAGSVGVLAAVTLVVAEVLRLAGHPTDQVVPLYVAFAVLTVAGERLELSKVVLATRGPRVLFALMTVMLLTGLVVMETRPESGAHLVGAGLFGLGLWHMRFDLARRNLRLSGLQRFVATNLLAGFVWLALGGLLWICFGEVVAGPRYEAVLHPIFLGFLMSMIFGHAPIVFPAVLGVALPYRPALYAHVVLLHASLILRVVSALAEWVPGRQWGGILNAAAILLFLANSVRSAVLAARAGESASGAR